MGCDGRPVVVAVDVDDDGWPLARTECRHDVGGHLDTGVVAHLKHCRGEFHDIY